jgi:phosphoglucomutase
MRPSGTEPKIKFYFGVKTDLASHHEYDEKNREVEARIDNIIKDLDL